ncbi:recombinase family protein [Micrococcus luteus]|uniref:recombinase family protein n=1 Tax=Micrococcus TaxID=1269 RepID=UPI003701262A|nr:recombinase family protein [Micrococcus luteus]
MGSGQTIAYLRVSSAGQNLDRQEHITEGADRVFREKASAKTRDRPALHELIAYARQGDTVRVWSIDRLARDLRDLDSIVQDLIRKGVTVRFEKENLTYSPDADTSPMERLMFQMLGIFGEFERSIIDERRREGVAAAQAAGKLTHRPPALTPEQAAEVVARHAQGVPVARIAREAGVSRNTVYKALREAHSAVEGTGAPSGD